MQEAANRITGVGLKAKATIAKATNREAMSKRSQDLKLHFLIATTLKGTIMGEISKTDSIEPHLKRDYSSSIYLVKLRLKITTSLFLHRIMIALLSMYIIV